MQIVRMMNYHHQQQEQYCLPFDCHNHIQLGLLHSKSSYNNNNNINNDHDNDDDVVTEKDILWRNEVLQQFVIESNSNKGCCGMAVMSTHPRDFPLIDILSSSSSSYSTTTTNNTNNNNNFHIVPCYGIHPWFIHELSDDDWLPVSTSTSSSCCSSTKNNDNDNTIHTRIDSSPKNTNIETTNDDDNDSNDATVQLSLLQQQQQSLLPKELLSLRINGPKWMYEIEVRIRNNPKAIIGEIGLDKFHYYTTTTSTTNNDIKYQQQQQLDKVLTTCIEQQVHVFQLQLQLACYYQRPVCIHCVQAFGPLLDILQLYATTTTTTTSSSNIITTTNTTNIRDKEDPTVAVGVVQQQQHQRLPPKIYFHAYGGKLATISQILSICEGVNNKKKNLNKKSHKSTNDCKCYFGFAPVVNFRSPKTRDIIRTIGLSRLLLETDIEDVSIVNEQLDIGIRYIQDALNNPDGDNTTTTSKIIIDNAYVIEQTTKNAFEFYNL